MFLSKPKILIIDDDSMAIMSKQIIMKKFNYSVLMCNNGLKGIELAKRNQLNLIILDWMMPNYSGLQTLKDLKKDEAIKDIPVLMLTGKNLVGEIEDAFLAGASAYITKPLNSRKLVNKVEELIQLD